MNCSQEIIKLIEVCNYDLQIFRIQIDTPMRYLSSIMKLVNHKKNNNNKKQLYMHEEVGMRLQAFKQYSTTYSSNDVLHAYDSILVQLA